MAAGLVIAFLALGRSLTTVISQSFTHPRFRIWVGLTTGARPFTSQAVTVAASAPGIAGAQPVETSSRRLICAMSRVPAAWWQVAPSTWLRKRTEA